MPERQYELMDCLENGIIGAVYRIGYANSIDNKFGHEDKVIGFNNPKTRKIVFIPYGSMIRMDGLEYIVERGKLKPYEGERMFEGKGVIVNRRIFTHDQDIRCLRNNHGISSMLDFMEKKAEVIKLNDSVTARLERYFFDVAHNKLPPNGSFKDNLVRYGLLKK